MSRFLFIHEIMEENREAFYRRRKLINFYWILFPLLVPVDEVKLSTGFSVNEFRKLLCFKGTILLLL